MSHHWLLITFSWFGTVSLQYISSASPENNVVPSSEYPPNFANQPDDYALRDISPEYVRDEEAFQKKRKTVDDDKYRKNWVSSAVDTGKNLYLENNELIPFYYDHQDDSNKTVGKKNFSPWGGKRDGGLSAFGHMWSWKRAASLREPSMPKRVRFSPWGGKRSGQMIYKPGNKASKVIFSSSVPELTRIVSKYSTNDEFHVTGFQFIPGMDKRHPIKILALSTNLDDKTIREALPFKTFLEAMPKMYKPGHPYHDVQLKKDGKRKVKFSAWGGKRSPPVIGPIWTPAPEDLKESALNTILLIREDRERDRSM